MNDVFIRAFPETVLRQRMFELCLERWKMDPLAWIVTLPKELKKDLSAQRHWADSHSKSELYIFTDDDCLIVGKDWIARGLEAMHKCPEYGIGATLSLIEGENVAKGEGIMYPMHMVGHPMFVRKGLLADVQIPDWPRECAHIQLHIERKGFREGIINGLRHNHLGHGFSGTPGHDFGA